MNTTACHLGRYEPSSFSTKELHALLLLVLLLWLLWLLQIVLALELFLLLSEEIVKFNDIFFTCFSSISQFTRKTIFHRIGRSVGRSVTRLGDCTKSLATNFLIKAAQIFGNFWAFLKNITFKVKTTEASSGASSGKHWATIY